MRRMSKGNKTATLQRGANAFQHEDRFSLQLERAVVRSDTPQTHARVVRIDVMHGNMAALLRLKLLLQPSDFSCKGGDAFSKRLGFRLGGDAFSKRLGFRLGGDAFSKNGRQIKGRKQLFVCRRKTCDIRCDLAMKQRGCTFVKQHQKPPLPSRASLLKRTNRHAITIKRCAHNNLPE